MGNFKELISKKVNQLYLKIWAPSGKEEENQIDISFGFVFNDDQDRLCLISVDRNELWSPHITQELLPQITYTWDDYYDRIKLWMEADYYSEMIIDYEYYDVTNCELFQKIIDSEIVEIELISIENDDEPFGVKIYFKGDYIISIPSSDANTVETKIFHKKNWIDDFSRLGKIVFSKV